MKIEVVGYINEDGSVTPSVSDEEFAELLETFQMTEDELEEVDPSKLVIEVIQ